MRYIKVLALAVFLFLAMVFFFQNQAPLSQQMELSLNLFFIPPIKSISLPFYFLVIASFFMGCILSLMLLVWDKFSLSARLMKNKWLIGDLQRQVDKLQAKVDQNAKNAALALAASKKDNDAKPEAVADQKADKS